MSWDKVLAGSVVANFDPKANMYSPPRWLRTKPILEQLSLKTQEVLGIDLLPRFEDNLKLFDRKSLYFELINQLRSLDTFRSLELESIVKNTEELIGTFFHCESQFTKSYLAPVTVRAHTSGKKIYFVIPFRSNEETKWRLRNLLATLYAINNQRLTGTEISIVVVESDSVPRNREIISSLVDEYIFINYHGPFNRAACINAGVESVNEYDSMVCILDADIVLPRNFCSALPDMNFSDVLIPYWGMFYLDDESSEMAASRNFPDKFEFESAYGYVSPLTVGASLVITKKKIVEISGFDEDFVGWGGEDRDFFNRLEKVANVIRWPNLLLHLQHERPLMPSTYEEVLDSVKTKKSNTSKN